MILGIDIGTSAVKTVATRDGAVVHESSAPLTVSSPRAGWSEQDPETWWTAVRATLGALAEKGVALEAVEGIGLSGQMHGAVCLDATGAVLRPAILWNDSRAMPQCHAMEAAVPDVGQIGGVRPLPGFTAPKLAWLKENEPDLHAKIAHVLLPKDFVGFRLHGGYVTDRSDAAGTLWMDQAKGLWSETLAEASATPMQVLPAIMDGTGQAGAVTAQVAGETGLPEGCPVFAGGGDAATGAVSMGVTEPGRGFISLGTSGQLFVADRVYRPNPAQFVHAFAHTVPRRWYQMAAMLNGARPIAWVAGIMGISPGEVVVKAAQADPRRVPIFLPYLTGERSPHGDPDIRGAFVGLEDATDKAAMARAVVDAVAFSFADAAQSFGDGLAGIDYLAAIGGGAQSDLVLQQIADATGIRIGRSAGAAAGPAFGAARLAACGLGQVSLDDLGARPEIETWFDPVTQAGLPERLERYRAVYRALKPLH